MIVPIGTQAASENLVHTYLELGAATAGSKIWREDGFCACVGPLDHPVCNFATDLRLDHVSVARLFEIARGRKSFSVYSLPGPQKEQQDDLLLYAGFVTTHRLLQMTGLGRACENSGELLEATAPEERRRVATFMAEQFFSRQAFRYRKGIVEATAGATKLRLFRLENQNRVEAALMLCEHGGTLGIYNLCVDAPLRGRGIGGKLVKEVGRWAQRNNLALTLQCDPSLKKWYERFNYVDAGEVTVYGLPRFGDVDIMGA